MAQEQSDKTEKVKAAVQNLSTLWEIWSLFDTYSIGMMEEAMGRMNKASTELNIHIGNLLEKSKIAAISRAEITKAITEARGKDDESVDKILNQLKTDSEDSSISVLLGLVKHFLLIEQRMIKIFKITEKIASSNVNNLDLVQIKNQMTNYGIDLQHIWKHCEIFCEAYDENVMFYKKIYNKDIAFQKE